MASYIWSGSAGGDWSDPANWTPSGVPGSSDTALVNLAGSYTIALDVASIGSLTFDAPGVTIAPSMAFALAGVLDVQSGTFVVNSTITGGTLKPDGGTIDYAGGTLDGVTVTGPLDLSATDATVSIKDGISFAGPAPEQIIVTGYGANLQLQDNETLNDAAITLGSTTGYYSVISGSGLTLGASSTLTTNGNAYVQTSSLDNQGTITAATGDLVDSAATNNQGSIVISFGSNSITSLASNTGTISVSGSKTELTVGNVFDNTGGIITVASGASLFLNSTETDAQLGTINHSGGTVVLGGRLDNTDSTLDITSGSTLDGASLAGTIIGGTVGLDGGTIGYDGGTLDGVTLAGPLNLSAANADVSIEDGITFAGTGPEQIIDTGVSSGLDFEFGDTLNKVAITIGGPSGEYTGDYSYLGTGSGITLGSSSTLTTAGIAVIYGQGFDNQGGITAATGYLLDDVSTTKNEGSIAISDGSTSSTITSITNTGTISVSGAGTMLRIGNAASSGSIEVTGGATLTTQGTFDNTSGTITLAANSTLDLQSTETDAQLGTIDRNGGSLTLGGTLNNTGNTLDITAGSLLDGADFTGTITGGTVEFDGGTLAYAGGTLEGVTLAGPLDLSASNASVTIENGITFTGTGPEQILITGNGASLNLDGSETLNNVAISLVSMARQSSLNIGNELILTASSTLTTAGGAYIDGQLLDNKGSITATAGYLFNETNTNNEGSITIGDGGANELSSLASNTGTIELSGTGTQLFVGNAVTSGNINIANGAELVAQGTFHNTGAITLNTGAALDLMSTNGGDARLGAVSFLGHNDTLLLNESSDGTLNLFQSSDAIDLSGNGYSLDHVGNTLTVSQVGTVVDSFALTGQDYSNANFTLTSDVITTDAPCFCTGTLILTDRGECAVEALEVGDLVVTLQDGIPALSPVQWLGRRRVVVIRHPEPEHVDPIRIARDAVAPGMPVRDLFVSPDHALFLDGMLIQARQLVNHMTITRDGGRATVTYVHVELDRHAVLIADGMPCESYLDSGNRGRFDTQGTVVPLHPPADRARQACAPLVTDAAMVRPVWQRLTERAYAAGHVAPVSEFEPEILPWLETVEGVRLTPCGDGRHVALPPGCLRVRLRSANDRPTTLSPWSDDRRRLGVAISALTLHRGAWRQSVALETIDAAAGWWPLEMAGGLVWRWSDGDGWIDLPEPAETIELTLHATMRVSVTAPAGGKTHAAAG